ncbi:MAG: sigma-54 dependent transcriptional regulator [bacterium]|nr:sigma-54 dependent transcriptional regulator [bacterium]
MKRKIDILIVDDEECMRGAMDAVIKRMGHNTVLAVDGADALRKLGEHRFDLVISDMRMPEVSGDILLREIHKKFPLMPVVMITAYGTISQAVEAMRDGAYDFITKPFSGEDLESVVNRVTSDWDKAPQKKASASRSDSRAIITADDGMKKLIEIAVTIAPSNASVLIQGESGTGKELLARLLHASSPRSKGTFVAVNCAAVPGNLLESELFGHEKGSFTGAMASKEGKFELANGGTILLDEVSEMDAVLQAKLLRVLQEREIDRVGGTKPIPIDVRVVATTNRKLEQYVRAGNFREDLYYRLNVVPLFVPALRARRGDIKLLVEHFLRKYSSGRKFTVPEPLMKEITDADWPGNIRELENACQRAVILAGAGELQREHFFLGSISQPALTEEPSPGADMISVRSGMTVAEAEKKLIYETLKQTEQNRTKAAEMLGISIRTLRNKLNEYGDET